ncbi:MAG TPA: helix-turn-helix domain-containing protein [Cyanophyceae cyanobacterium]
MPSIAGIYFAIDSSGRIQYIGRSVNLRQRWLAHHKKAQLGQIGEISLVWLEVSETWLLPEIESALIDWFKPLLNRGVTKRFCDKDSGSTTEPVNPVESEGSNVGKNVMQLRRRAGLTQKQIADALGLTVQTISNWETGLKRPKLYVEQVLKLCLILGCSLSDLADDLDTEKKSKD